MAVVIEGNQYLRTHEALKQAGISRATFFRWLKKGVIPDTFLKDRRGWRLFSESDISRIRHEAEKTYVESGLESDALGNHSEAE